MADLEPDGNSTAFRVFSSRISGTDDLLHNNEAYADSFDRGDLLKETGIKPTWSPESFTDLDDDVRSSIGRIKGSPFIPHKDSVRGFVYDVHTGRLREVATA